MPDNESYRSLNRETGMLEDINEVRKVGVELALLAQSFLRSPVFRMTASLGLVMDTAVYALISESVLRPMSQAEFYQRLGELIGVDPLLMEIEVASRGLSTTLPISHPNAVKMDLEPLDPNNPLVKESSVLSNIAAKEQEKKRQQQERVDLPENLEGFLRSLLEKEQDSGKE